MSVRIDQILVHPGGPLKETFDFSCGDLNLVYGDNETGKSYVVEFLIRCLFLVGPRLGAGWKLRDLGGRGGVTVSGHQDSPVKFTPSKRPKIDEAWNEDPGGFPQDLCRLLVVKEGAARLTVEETADGIDDNLLKSFLSGEHLFDQIRQRVPKSVSAVELGAGTIDGDQRWPDLKERSRLAGRIETLGRLIAEFNEDVSGGAVLLHEQTLAAVRREILRLDAARGHRAGEVAAEVAEFLQQQAAVPATAQIEELAASAGTWRKTRSQVQEKQRQQRELAGQQQDHAWAVAALANYDRILAGRGGKRGRGWLAIAAAASLLGGVVAGLFEYRWPLAGLSLLAAWLWAADVWRAKQAGQTETSNPVELGLLSAEFQRRFGEPLGDRSTLESRIGELEKQANRAELLDEQLRNETAAFKTDGDAVVDLLKQWTGEPVQEAEWDRVIGELRTQRIETDRSLEEARDRLDQLDVDPDDYLEQPAEVAWNAATYADAEARQEEAEELLDAENESQRGFRERIVREGDLADTLEPATATWEELLDGLEQRQQQLQEEFRGVTARMLAHVVVLEVLDEIGEEEHERICEGLEKVELTESIRLMHPHFQRITLDDNRLTVVDDADNAYAVADLSTGAREQLFLGARLGFARIALDGQPSFLVLDDAFQDSDWGRRETMVAKVVELVEAGWQVFYFTMDRNIQELFQQAGKTLGERFREDVL